MAGTVLNVSAYSLSRLPVATLATYVTNCDAAINAVLGTAQSYDFYGRRVDRADLDSLVAFRSKLAEAQALQSGTRIKVTYTDFRT